MEQKFSVVLTKQELDVIGTLIDVALKARGLEVEKFAHIAVSRLEAATEIKEEKEKDNATEETSS